MLIIFAKRSFLNFWQGSEYASVIDLRFSKFLFKKSLPATEKLTYISGQKI